MTPIQGRELEIKNIDELKDLRDKVLNSKKEAVIREQVTEIKSYSLYSEIIDTFKEIISDELYVRHLYLNIILAER